VDQEIRIKAMLSPFDPTLCTFVVDRPVLPDRSFFFPDLERAKGSPLPERIFELPGIQSVLVANDTITVHSESEPEDWRATAHEIGSAIRTLIESGAMLVSDEAFANLPSPEVLRASVQRIIEERINPVLAGHGGHVELLDVDGNALRIRMEGGCQGCGMASATLRFGIEQVIRELAPEVGEIVDATDHSAGRKPFYAPPAREGQD